MPLLESQLRSLNYKNTFFARIHSGLRRPKAAPTSSGDDVSGNKSNTKNKTSNGSGKKSPRESATATTTTTQTNLQSNALTSSTQSGFATTTASTVPLQLDTSLLNVETFCGREFQIPPELSISEFTILYIGEESPLLVNLLLAYQGPTATTKVSEQLVCWWSLFAVSLVMLLTIV
jgi:hypothetical protein